MRLDGAHIIQQPARYDEPVDLACRDAAQRTGFGVCVEFYAKGVANSTGAFILTQ
jgi:hypothetical protein